MTLLQKHPEIKNFENDRFILSSSTKEYLEQIPANLKTGLREFREIISKSETLEFKKTESPFQNLNLTHTPKQFERLQNLFEKAQNNLPLEKSLRKKVIPGLYLDLRNEGKKEFTKQLDSFVEQVENLPNPKPIKFDLEKLGWLPLETVHQKENSNFFDPYLGDKIDTVWTLDVTDNPGFSIKDIVALEMVKEALKRGDLNSETIIVEGTSGNTGAGLAVVALNYGLKCILTIPDKQSQEKINRLRDLGAHVIVTPTKVEAEDIRSYYSARDYVTQKVQGWKPNQYHNLDNFRSHQKVSGPNIWQKTKGEVTAAVICTGTCGTASGVGSFLKKKNPDIKIIAIDTVGSILYLLHRGFSLDKVEKYARSYDLQGFGEDIHPQNLQNEYIDHYIRVSDKTGMQITQILPSLGFLGGQSSGSAFAGLLEALSQNLLTKKDKVVVIFPDMGFFYRKDVYNDTWMKKKGYL
jgi:cystathionine beta-synthase